VKAPAKPDKADKSTIWCGVAAYPIKKNQKEFNTKPTTANSTHLILMSESQLTQKSYGGNHKACQG